MRAVAAHEAGPDGPQWPFRRVIRRPLARGRCSEPAKATRGRGGAFSRSPAPARRCRLAHTRMQVATCACIGHAMAIRHDTYAWPGPHMLCTQARARTTQAAVSKGPMGSYRGRWRIPGAAGLARQGNQVTRLRLVPRLREPSRRHAPSHAQK